MSTRTISIPVTEYRKDFDASRALFLAMARRSLVIRDLAVEGDRFVRR